ncbi:hypothetical protein J1N35_011966 [Gossypium stocksii]|uniref:Uncharacterized protein n=1 Tax=Gossypium stocksii TaxID=47602 RepID=A0A9D3W5E8_9ROSI|nr:hypothetical protein J1N35_011966 [Gossypium stocksii]
MYVTIEMHKIDRVLRQFGFRQSIPVGPQDLGDLHLINLRRPDENWLLGHLSNHLLLDWRMHDGNQECKDCNRRRRRKEATEITAPRKVNEEGIQRAIVDHPDGAQILTGIWID